MEYGLATSFYNKFITSRPIDSNNKLPENEVFSNFRLADYFFDLHVDNIIDLPIYSGGLGVLAGDTMKKPWPTINFRLSDWACFGTRDISDRNFGLNTVRPRRK